MVRTYTRLAAALLIVVAARTVSAAEPVAIVQSADVAAAPGGAMRFVEPGDVFDLGQGKKLVLGYIHSCLREEITGGRVTVGLRRSIVENGRVSRRWVECDGGALRLTREQAAGSATLILRGQPKTTARR